MCGGSFLVDFSFRPPFNRWNMFRRSVPVLSRTASKVRQDFERQVEDLSGKCRMLEQDLKASEDKDRTRRIDLDEAHQKVNLLQVAKAGVFGI